jgi:hypothetical protein
MDEAACARGFLVPCALDNLLDNLLSETAPPPSPFLRDSATILLPTRPTDTTNSPHTEQEQSAPELTHPLVLFHRQQSTVVSNNAKASISRQGKRNAQTPSAATQLQQRGKRTSVRK